MHNNYYFLRQLTTRLSRFLTGASLAEAFSQNRDELILGFTTHDPGTKAFFIKAYLDAKFCCLQFPEDFHRARKNSVNLFEDIIGATVQKIYQFENERSFALHLVGREQQAYQLLFKMHGNRSNIIMFREQQVVEVFKNSLANDAALSLAELDRTLEINYEQFEQAGGLPSALYPTLGKLPNYYLQHHQYDSLTRPQQWELLQRTIQQLEQPEQFYVIQLDDQIHLSLLPLGTIQAQYTDPIEAINAFFLAYIKDEQLLSLKKRLTQRLRKEQKQTEGYLQKARRRLQQLTTGLSYQQTADIIMANMHAIPTNVAQVTLHDFYHQQDVAIKLNTKLSPQKNAENYYRKAKNQKIEIAEAEKNIDRREEKLLALLTHLEAIEAVDNPKILRAYAEEHDLVTTTSSPDTALPYRHTIIDGFDVYIGKSAKSNDTLLRQQAQKDDLWLHAKDVSGSHVLIKRKGNDPFPQPLIEKAARLAAYYSKRKNDSLAPVIYTPSKYVRKGKNMPAGAVRVDREEVILVEPQALGNE